MMFSETIFGQQSFNDSYKGFFARIYGDNDTSAKFFARMEIYGNSLGEELNVLSLEHHRRAVDLGGTVIFAVWWYFRLIYPLPIFWQCPPLVTKHTISLKDKITNIVSENPAT